MASIDEWVTVYLMNIKIQIELTFGEETQRPIPSQRSI
jgi:hypothetical protein